MEAASDELRLLERINDNQIFFLLFHFFIIFFLKLCFFISFLMFIYIFFLIFVVVNF